MKKNTLTQAVAFAIFSMSTVAMAETITAPDADVIWTNGTIQGDKFAVYSINGHTIDIDAENVSLTASQRVIQAAYASRVIVGNPTSTTKITAENSNTAFGILASNSAKVEINGADIELNSVSAEGVAYGIFAQHEFSDNKKSTGASRINIGSATDTKTKTKTIKLVADGNSESYGICNIKSNVTLEADEIIIKSSGLGVHVGNNTQTEQAPDNAATTTLKANKITIKSEGSAISAYSNGTMNIIGDLTVNAKTAIDVRGYSTTNINPEGTGTVVLVGDIAFETPGPTMNSGDIIDAYLNLNLVGKNSSWTGNVYREYPEKYKGQESTNVTGFNFSLKDGAQWTPKTIENSSTDTADNKGNHYNLLGEGIAVNKLTLEDGIVNLTESSEQTVQIEKLEGTGGTLNVQTKINGDVATTSKLSVDSVSSESMAMAVNYTGINSDQLTPEVIESLSSPIVTNAEGDQAKITTTEHVAEGDVNGEWTRKDGESTGSYGENTKLSDYSSVNAIAMVQWRNEINHLTKRLGDIRASESAIGGWARVYGGASEWDGGSREVETDFTTIQVGGDYRINNNWIVGGAFSYTDSDADIANGSADGEAYSLAVYGTWLGETGSYLDMIARFGHLKNDITAGNMALETSSNAFSLSFEGGHKFTFLERAYIEPQIEITYGNVLGDDVTASNGVRIEQDDYENLITRVGLRTGFEFPEKAGTFYAMLSYSYDWMGDADGTATKGDNRATLCEDLGGGWVSYGVGAQFKIGNNAFAYGELERTSGGDVRNPYLFNVGFRYNF